MIIALIILFFIVIIDFFIVILFFSNIVLNIEKAEIHSSNIKDIFDENKINIKVYLFKKIKIINIKIFKNYLEIYGMKINIEKIYKFANKEKIYSNIRNAIILLKDNYKEVNLKNLKPEIKKIDMKMEFSTENAILTSAITVSISSLISILFKNFIKKYNENKHYYKITPQYANINKFNISLETDISFSTIEIVIFAYEFNRLMNLNSNVIQNRESIVTIAINRSIEILRALNKVIELNKRARANELKSNIK